MSSDIHTQLINLCERYGKHLQISHWRVSFLIRGDGQFFYNLNRGRSCTVKTAQAVLKWFSDHWPEDLEWPDDVPRPEVSEAAGGAGN